MAQSKQSGAHSFERRIRQLEEQVQLVSAAMVELQTLYQQDAAQRQQELVRRLVVKAAPVLGKLAAQVMAARAANELKERNNGERRENPDEQRAAESAGDTGADSDDAR